MKRIFFIFALLSAPAHAGTYNDAHGRAWDIIDPPARWLAADYSGKIDIKPMPPEGVLAYCQQITGKFEKFGCALPMPHYCLIAVSDNLPADFREAVIRHEEAHCRGWGADHPMD